MPRKRRRKSPTDLIDYSAFRGESSCVHFPLCGGCLFRDVRYEDQIRIKTQLLDTLVQHHYPGLKIAPIIPSPSYDFYRNKMEFSFFKQDDRIILGLKERHHFDRVVEISDCRMMSVATNQILRFSAEFFTQFGCSVWDPFSHQGVLRYLVIRHSKAFDQYLVNLIVSVDEPELCRAYSAALVQAFPSAVSVWQTVHSRHGDTAMAGEPTLLCGRDTIDEMIGPYRFSISPFSFFQTNSIQASSLYDVIRDSVDWQTETHRRGGLRLLDLYCGTGSIGIYLGPTDATNFPIELSTKQG